MVTTVLRAAKVSQTSITTFRFRRSLMAPAKMLMRT